jgi:protoporphyrinogen/coproporphyrinogen III oxidase
MPGDESVIDTHDPGPAGTRDVVVVGGGIAGMAAAWHLRDHDVVVLEAERRIGGRIRSEARDGVWLNLGAHVFGGPGSATGRLIDRAGVHAAPVPGHLAAVALGGRIVAGGMVETYPFRLPLSLRSRASLIRAGLALRLAVRRYAAIAGERAGEDAAERQQRLLDFLDDRSFSDFIGPLPGDVDAIFRATLNRSSGEPEELAAGYGIGYFHLVWNRSAGLSRNILGGSSRLIDALAADVKDRVVTGARATEVRAVDDGVLVRYHQRGSEHEARARAAIVATPAYVTREIVRNLPPETDDALASVRYGPYVVGAFLTGETRSMPWDELYALATPHRSFSMLFNTANVLRVRGAERQPGGSLMVYAAAGGARELADLDDARVSERFLADLDGLFPDARDVVREVVVQRWQRGLPYAAVGRARLQAPLTRPLGPIHLAGDYLGTWYTETAAQTAEAAANSVRDRLAEHRTRPSRVKMSGIENPDDSRGDT